MVLEVVWYEKAKVIGIPIEQTDHGSSLDVSQQGEDCF